MKLPAQPGAAFTDDGDDGGFEAGTFAGTVLEGDLLTLQPGRDQGDFISRVFDAREPDTEWDSIAWRPQAPYGVALPDDGASESGYRLDAVDMTDNVLLLHLDADGSLVDGATLEDTSGRGNDATVRADGGVLAITPGPFGDAIDDDVFTSVIVPMDRSTDFQFGRSSFTWALWTRTTEDCTGNKVHLGVEDNDFARSHVWLGCADADALGECPAGAPGGRAAGAVFAAHEAQDGVVYCGTSTINDGEWHHLVLVKQGHAPATVQLYVDGVLEYTQSGSFDNEFAFPSNPNLTVGDFSDGTGQFQADAELDEIAVWRRAMSPDEVGALYRRGVLRLGFQVRACVDATCSQATEFAGPDADPDALFVDAPDQLEGEPERFLELVTGQFVQYKAVFESELPGESPQLSEVTLTTRE